VEFEEYAKTVGCAQQVSLSLSGSKNYRIVQFFDGEIFEDFKIFDGENIDGSIEFISPRTKSHVVQLA